MSNAPSTIPTTRQRFRGAIAATATLDSQAGICEAIHKAELRELFEELEELLDHSNDSSASAFYSIKNEYCG